MNPASVMNIINNAVFRPEWSFCAAENDRMQNGVAVTVTYQARDWGSRENPDAWRTGYAAMVPGRAKSSFLITTGAMQTPADVYRAMLVIIARIDSHEAREALRTPDGYAPFHPHNEDSMAAWGDVPGDLTFGAI